MGLLDYLDNPAVQGLLAAGFGGLTSRTVAGGIGRGGLLGLTAYNNAQNGIADRQRDAKREQLFDVQMAQHQQTLDAAKVKAQQEALRRNYLAGAGQVTSPVIGAAPNQFDPTKWIGMGGSIEEAKALADRGNWGKAKIKDYKDIKNADGSVTVTGFDEFGQPVNTGAAPFKAPEIRDFGGYVGGIDPITGKVSNYGAKTMSAAERDASARGWAGVNLNREEFNYNKTKDAGGIAKPEWRDGQWVTPPKDMKPGEVRPAAPAQGVRDANDALSLIAQAREILPKATGSYGGVAADHIARVFGKSTDGAMAASQLQALEGALVAKMPKMSGPQSDKDVAMYKQMAGVVGDATRPIQERMAALDVVEQIQRRHAGGNGGKPEQTSPRISNDVQDLINLYRSR